MKKYTALLLTSMLAFCLTAQSQDTLVVKAGLSFNPLASISLQNPEKGFTGGTPLSITAQFSKKNGGINLMYNAFANKAQIIYFHSLSPQWTWGIYLLGNKNLLAKGGYASIGITKSVPQQKALIFMEAGSGWDNWSPIICMGLIIPFMIKL